MRNFLNYVKADLSESMGDFNDDYVRNLQESVRNIKSDREMGERYMLLKDLLKDERKNLAGLRDLQRKDARMDGGCY